MTAAHERFSRAIELGVRLDNDWRHLERRIRDTIPDLAAASYDGEPADPIVWCDEHERPVLDCRRAELLCDGIPLAAKTDPTGDAAVGNRAWQDAGKYVAWSKKAAHALEEMAKIAAHYKPDDPRQSLEVEQANDRSTCEWCARLDRWVPSLTAKPTDVGGVLDEPARICSPHYDFVRTRNRRPTTEEDQRYAMTGRWPKVRQTERLVSGLKTGTLG